MKSIRKYQSPSKYIQGDGLLENIVDYIGEYGNRMVLISDSGTLNRCDKQLSEAFKDANKPFIYTFEGMVTQNNIMELCKNIGEKSDIIIGLGGGKIMDVTKAVGYFLRQPICVVPTIASMDGVCSGLSVLYTEEGAFDRYLYLRNNPDLVLVDTGIIVKAPAFLLAAGIGDGLSTYFEARQNKGNSLAAMSLARACYETIKGKACKAMDDCNNNKLSEEVEDVIEANLLLSGIGFESGGLSFAHPLHNAMTKCNLTGHKLHGEIVAFTTLIQLELEQAKELTEVENLVKSIHLPTHFHDIIDDVIGEDEIQRVAELALGDDTCIEHFKVEDVVKVLMRRM